MRKSTLFAMLFLFVFYSISCQAECFNFINVYRDGKSEHRIVKKTHDIEQELDNNKDILQEVFEVENQELYSCYIIINKIRPCVPAKYKNVVVKTKFRPQAARMSVDDGTSFIFA